MLIKRLHECCWKNPASLNLACVGTPKESTLGKTWYIWPIHASLRNHNKNVACVFLLLLCWMPLVLLLSFDLRQQDIRERMQHKLQKEVLVTIKVAADQVIWMDRNEIWVNEQMFDICTSRQENGEYIFTGLYDEEETLVLLEREGFHEQSNQKSALAMKYFSWLYSLLPAERFQPETLPVNFSAYTISCRADLLGSYQNVPTPPPRTGFV